MENNIPKFTFCITSKNNLRYLKHAVFYIKENSSREHDILVFIDADSDGTENWCKDNNIKYIKNQSDKLFGIGNAYNLLVKESQTDFNVIYHADMIMGKGFDVALYSKWKPKTVVSATRIEPPLHPSDPSKIVLDFGLWPELDIVDGFKLKEFNEFVDKNKKDIVTNGIFAPWLIHKDDFNDVNGHDPIMKSHSEDRDLFNRFLLNGYDLIQSWEALVYHLTCRGGQFEHASKTKDLNFKSNDWNILAHNQTREFIRKWGTPPKYNELGTHSKPKSNMNSCLNIDYRNIYMELLEHNVKTFKNIIKTSDMNDNTQLMSLYDYLKKPAGTKLGKEVYLYARKTNQAKHIQTREISNSKYKGTVLLYPKHVLDQYFAPEEVIDLPF